MAKNIPSPGRSKVRILFVEADVAPGELKELTASLSSAIRAPPTPVARTETHVAQSPQPLGNGTNGDAESVPDIEEASSMDESAADDASSKPRKYRSPKPVADLDMNAGGKSFEAFAAEKGNPEDNTTRYLLASAWLSQYPKIPTVTVDHVFTCYKSAGWTFDVADPGSLFRYLKKEGFGDTKAGKFTINHLGLAKVEKMKLVQP